MPALSEQLIENRPASRGFPIAKMNTYRDLRLSFSTSWSRESVESVTSILGPLARIGQFGVVKKTSLSVLALLFCDPCEDTDPWDPDPIDSS